MKKRILTTLLTTMITLMASVFVYAASNEYAISAIDLIVTVPEGLNVLTRNVSDGNPALDILEDADAISLRNMYLTHNIYLDAFPDDLKYEILITATPNDDINAKNFNEISDTDLDTYCENLKKDLEANKSEELLDMDILETATTKFVVIYTHSTKNDISVYSKRCTTTMNGYNYNFAIQTDNLEITPSLEEDFLSIVNSANFTEVKSSIKESGLFMDIYETFIGFALTVLVLGAIIFFTSRTSKKH